MTTFEMYRDDADRHRRRATAGSGQTIATAGAACTHRTGARNGVDVRRRDVPRTAIDEVPTR